ncbi:MAG: hypothetical protein ABIE74_09320, partial [Pseudomonadota bacterium]
LIGLSLEVTLKAIWNSITTKSIELKGEGSLVLFPVYGFIAIFYPILFHQIKDLEWYIRGGIYAFLFLLVEFLLCKLFDRVHIHALAFGKDSFFRLPLWFFIGLGIERIFPMVLTASRYGI